MTNLFTILRQDASTVYGFLTETKTWPESERLKDLKAKIGAATARIFATLGMTASLYVGGAALLSGAILVPAVATLSFLLFRDIFRIAQTDTKSVDSLEALFRKANLSLEPFWIRFAGVLKKLGL